MKIRVKTFKELTTSELYDALQLRSAVFVVEQNCIYQDIDGKDEKAIHVLGYIEDVLVAYTRLFKPGDYFNSAAIGRVVVHQNYRGQNLAYKIMKASLKAIHEYWNTDSSELSAQTYLRVFYSKLGYVEVGEGYLEDGIPHIKMKRN